MASTIAVPYFMGERLLGLDVPSPHDVVELDEDVGTPQQRMGRLYDRLATWVSVTDDPRVWAGDCVSILGVLAGLQRRGLEPTLVFFDAHGDFNTWETTPSGFLGGMPLAMATGRGERTIVSATGLAELADDRVWLVDGRDLDPAEAAALRDSGVHHVSVDGIAAEAPLGPLYVHVDLDVVDPTEMPAMKYPAPGGPSLSEVAGALTALAETGDVVALSLSSWNPALPGSDRAAAAARTLAAPFG